MTAYALMASFFGGMLAAIAFYYHCGQPSLLTVICFGAVFIMALVITVCNSFTFHIKKRGIKIKKED